MGQTDRISGHTKLITLIGKPVEHSMSPAMHNASFEYLGEDYVYLATEIDSPDDLYKAIQGMKVMGFAGCNVTMPYKRAIIPYLDELSPAAELMGAANTVVFEEGKAVGHNTDGAGFMRNLKENNIDIIGKKITLVGVGGAGSAIYTQAALDGVAAIDIYNSKDAFFDVAAERIADIAQRTGCAIRLIDLDNKEALKHSIEESALFINATRVGMGDLEGISVVPAELLVEGLVVADVIYVPRKTKLLEDAEAKGLKTINGLGMLLWQAAIAEDIWVGKEMPTELVQENSSTKNALFMISCMVFEGKHQRSFGYTRKNGGVITWLLDLPYSD